MPKIPSPCTRFWGKFGTLNVLVPRVQSDTTGARLPLEPTDGCSIVVPAFMCCPRNTSRVSHVLLSNLHNFWSAFILLCMLRDWILRFFQRSFERKQWKKPKTGSSAFFSRFQMEYNQGIMRQYGRLSSVLTTREEKPSLTKWIGLFLVQH